MNVTEWRAEAQRLRYMPGHDAIGVSWWKGWLDRHRQPPQHRGLPTSQRLIRQMSAVERIRLYERLDDDALVIPIRGGKDSRLTMAMVYAKDKPPPGRGGQVYRVT
jgi:hypothetical protein